MELITTLAIAAGAAILGIACVFLGLMWLSFRDDDEAREKRDERERRE
jgi:uncharacterized membrane protein